MDKRGAQPPEQLEPVFPKIPDEFWDKVGVKKEKGKTGGKRKGRRHNCMLVFFIWGFIVCHLSLILGVTSTNLNVVTLNVISEKGGGNMENKWGMGDKRGTKLEYTV